MTDATSELVMTFSSPQHAHLGRGMLEAQGIECWVTGDQMATTLSYYGAALSQVELWVKATDVVQAAELLAELETSDRQNDRWGLQEHRRWQCVTCQEANEQSFDECWSCSSQRTDDALLLPDEEPLQVMPVDPEVEPISAGESPYRVPSAASGSLPVPYPHNLTERAFKATIMGMVFPVPVMFFAAYLSFKAFQAEPRGWKLMTALLVSVSAALISAMLLLAVGGQIAGALLNHPF